MVRVTDPSGKITSGLALVANLTGCQSVDCDPVRVNLRLVDRDGVGIIACFIADKQQVTARSGVDCQVALEVVQVTSQHVGRLAEVQVGSGGEEQVVVTAAQLHAGVSGGSTDIDRFASGASLDIQI